MLGLCRFMKGINCGFHVPPTPSLLSILAPPVLIKDVLDQYLAMAKVAGAASTKVAFPVKGKWHVNPKRMTVQEKALFKHLQGQVATMPNRTFLGRWNAQARSSKYTVRPASLALLIMCKTQMSESANIIATMNSLKNRAHVQRAARTKDVAGAQTETRPAAMSANLQRSRGLLPPVPLASRQTQQRGTSNASSNTGTPVLPSVGSGAPSQPAVLPAAAQSLFVRGHHPAPGAYTSITGMSSVAAAAFQAAPTVNLHKKQRRARSCGVCGHLQANENTGMKAYHKSSGRGKVVCTVPAAMHVPPAARTAAKSRWRKGNPDAHACMDCLCEVDHFLNLT